MKIARTLIVLAALVTVLAAGPPRAAAQTYLGEFCWWYSETPGPGNAEVALAILPLKAGVTHLGGAYYLLQGRVDRGDLGNVPPDFLHATGVIVGDVVWITGSMTQDHVPVSGEIARDSGTIEMALSLSTLNGWFWRIQTDIRTTDGFNASFVQRYITGWVTFREACP